MERPAQSTNIFSPARWPWRKATSCFRRQPLLQLAEAAVAIAVRLALAILLPEQLQRHILVALQGRPCSIPPLRACGQCPQQSGRTGWRVSLRWDVIGSCHNLTALGICPRVLRLRWRKQSVYQVTQSPATRAPLDCAEIHRQPVVLNAARTFFARRRANMSERRGRWRCLDK
jgi:hypothetical protein